MIKVFISQPMTGLTDQQIVEERVELFRKAVRLLPDYQSGEVIPLYSYCPGPSFQSQNANGQDSPCTQLGRAITFLGMSDCAIFSERWAESRGCRIERACCLLYKIPILCEEDDSTSNDEVMTL